MVGGGLVVDLASRHWWFLLERMERNGGKAVCKAVSVCKAVCVCKTVECVCKRCVQGSSSLSREKEPASSPGVFPNECHFTSSRAFQPS